MARRLSAALVLTVVLSLLAPATIAPTSAAPPKAPKTIAITPHYTWSTSNSDCPPGSNELETRVMLVPPRGESTSEVWFADYPICAANASKSYGINRQPNPPRFPIFLSYETECTVGANGELASRSRSPQSFDANARTATSEAQEDA